MCITNRLASSGLCQAINNYDNALQPYTYCRTGNVNEEVMLTNLTKSGRLLSLLLVKLD